MVLTSEVACPYCGKPMLASWGSTCGQCRPANVAPKTMFGRLTAASVQAVLSTGLKLGWLVVLRTPDTAQIGTLFELDASTVVLTRGAGPQTTSTGKALGFADEFMSANHATISAPEPNQPHLPNDVNSRFRIRDRILPGPSANGTLVNDRTLGREEELELSDGDVILVGTTELLFRTLWLPPA